MLDRVCCRTDDVIARTIAGETFLVPISGDLANLRQIYTLGQVAACIWEGFDGRRSVGTIVTEDVLLAFAVEPDQAEQDACGFVQDLLKCGLLQTVNPDRLADDAATNQR